MILNNILSPKTIWETYGFDPANISWRIAPALYNSSSPYEKNPSRYNKRRKYLATAIKETLISLGEYHDTFNIHLYYEDINVMTFRDGLKTRNVYFVLKAHHHKTEWLLDIGLPIAKVIDIEMHMEKKIVIPTLSNLSYINSDSLLDASLDVRTITTTQIQMFPYDHPSIFVDKYIINSKTARRILNPVRSKYVLDAWVRSGVLASWTSQNLIQPLYNP